MSELLFKSELVTYQGDLFVEELSENQYQKTKKLMDSSLFFQLKKNSLKVGYEGRDVGRRGVQVLKELASILIEAQGEIVCELDMMDEIDPTFEFYSIQKAQLFRQPGKIIREAVIEISFLSLTDQTWNENNPNRFIFDALLDLKLCTPQYKAAQKILKETGLEFWLDKHSLELGEDSNFNMSTNVIDFLTELATIFVEADGDITCQLKIENADPVFEFYSIQKGQLFRQLGRIVRGTKQPI